MYKLALFVLGWFIAIESSAQYNRKSFPAYSDYIAETMDILLKKPKGFKWKNTGISLWSQGNRGIGATYEATMQSKNGDYLILYPAMSLMLGAYMEYEKQHDKKKVTPAREQMKKDREDALTSPWLLNCEKEVITLVGNNAPFNADTVFIAQLPLHKPYQDKYLYCIGIYIWKEGRVPMIFRCFFTEEGKKNEKKFFSKLYKMIRYRQNNNWSFDAEKARMIDYKQYLKSRQ